MLTEAGYWISVARTAAEVTEELTRGGIDILVVDADEAGESEILRTARKQTDLPIIALVGSAAGDAVVAAFDVGADDCAVWPDVSSDSGNVRELTRRHGALLKRARPRSPSATTEAVAGPGGLLMRPLAHEVSVSGVDLDLTPKEYGVLRLLLERRGEVLTTDAISQALWGYETFGARNFVEAHVSRLRHKLRLTGAPDLITTVQGVGYKVR
ncbi:MAG: response regulator transcription factor [Dehalococcoidia bacterium]|nr:response regulator transcription factor [Dehalococcoidia bacterium]